MNISETKIVVIGIGYVGLPLVAEFAQAGFSVVGYDKDPSKVAKLARVEFGRSRLRLLDL